MNKTDLINEVAKVVGGRRQAEEAVDAFLGAIVDALKKNDKVSISGFGTFSISKRAARKGRNPQTGQEIQIAAKNVPKFSAGKSLQDSVN